MTRVVMTKIS